MEYEGPNQGNPNYPERRPTNTGLVTEFRRVSQMVQNTNAANKSRKTSRITKGLNPDVPRPNPQPVAPPKNDKEADARKANQKASEISKMDEHRIPLEELCYRFGTNIETGLTNEQAIKRNA